MYRIEIDRSLCSGFGSCAELAPRSIAIGADGRARYLDAEGRLLAALLVNKPHAVPELRLELAIEPLAA